MLLVQEYLLTHTLADLYRDHGVKARVSVERPYKASFNYDQIEVVDADLLSQECRGLVLRTHDGSPMSENGVVGVTKVIARPFDRFFNVGQGAAANVDLNNNDTRLFEKLDGTLCIVYFDDIHQEWHVATRAVSEANLPLNGWDFTFRGLFEKALQTTRKPFIGGPDEASFEYWTNCLEREMTYIFELCTPLNQIVVQHMDESVTLIGCRITATGEECLPEHIAHNIQVRAVAQHRLGSMEELLEMVQSRDPRKFEGIVACQETAPGVFSRVKLKSAQYMVYSRLKDAVASPRNVMTLILTEKLDDAFIIMSDELKAESQKLQDGVRNLFKQYRQAYSDICADMVHLAPPMAEWGSSAHRKAFVRAAQQSGMWFDPAMCQYTGKISDIHEYIEMKKGVTGTWPDGFLDSILSLARR